MKKEHAFKYGKLEVRAKIDAQEGLWPAIWTLGVSGEWPSNGEVDVMEYYDGKILANFAHANTGRWQAIWDGASKTAEALGGKAWANQFHVWNMEWDEQTMNIPLDGELMNTIDLNTTVNKSDGKNPFQQPHYLLLNLATPQLYNLATDPGETKNLAAEYPERVKQMQEQLANIRKQ